MNASDCQGGTRGGGVGEGVMMPEGNGSGRRAGIPFKKTKTKIKESKPFLFYVLYFLFGSASFVRQMSSLKRRVIYARFIRTSWAPDLADR